MALLASCGGGKADTSAAEQTAAADGQARRQALALATSLAVPIVATTDPLMQGLTIPPDAPTKGMWSAVQAWPMNAIHLALLPDGRVTSYGSLPGSPDVSWGRSFDFWTPSLGFAANAHNTIRIDTAVNSFCDSQTLLPDGNMLLTGGVDSTLSGLLRWKTTDVVDTGAKLGNDRWYSTAITLADGRALTVGGMDINSEGVLLGTPDAAVANGIVSMTPEVYSPALGWRSLSGATNRLAFGPEQVRASYPKAWVAPNGRVFGVSADTLWQMDADANAGLGSTTVLGSFKTPYGAAVPVNVGTVATAVMFAPGRILQVGGNGGVASETIPGSNMATVLDINGPTPVLTEAAPMTQRRRMANSLVLADGSVVVTGGSRFANNVGTDAVYEAELWNPAAGTWTTGASAKVERVYHSTTLLLPNGTVLSAGGGAPGPVSNQNAEIYYPPYLFQTVGGVAQLAARPVLSGINATSFGYGQAVRVETATGQTVARLVLVRSGTVTHAFNNSQRFIELPFTQSGDFINATVPANPNLAPPGVYQLVVLNAAGVPSNAVLIGLGQNGSTPVVAPALVRGQTYALRSVGAPGLVIGTDPAGFGLPVAAANASAAPTSAQFVVRDGLSDAKCVSLESKASAGRWLRHASLRVGVSATDGTAAFATQATFCPEPAPGGTGVVLRSASHPGYVLHLRGGQVWVDKEMPTAAFVAESVFDAVVASAVPANVPPVVALTAPTANASAPAGAALVLSAAASDRDGTVARVEFYDGGTLIGTVSAAPYNLSWTPAVGAVGVHSLTAKTFDDAGASATSASITLTLTGANKLPTASVTAPLNGSTVPAGTPLTIASNPGDVDGYVKRVEFYDGAILIGTVTGKPWSIQWTGAVGPHSLSVKVFDNLGAVGTSKAVAITVSSATPNVPPAGALSCANEGGTCTVPAGATATVYYGAAGKFFSRTGVTGSLACTNNTFGDPIPGTGKTCAYVVTSPGVPPASGTGLEGLYYNGTHLSGASVAQRLEAINFDWGLAGPAGVPTDQFSARWSGFVEAPVTGSYLFRTQSDDGVRVWIDGVLVIDNWTAHGATYDTTPAIAMRSGERHSIRVEYEEDYGYAVMKLQWQVPDTGAFVAVPANRLYGPLPGVPPALGTGLEGLYFAGTSLSGSSVVRRLEAINFDWGPSGPAGAPTDQFSARWTGYIEAPVSGSYLLRTLSDDGVRVWVDGVLVIDNWTVHAATYNTSAAIAMKSGERRSIRVEYQEFFGFATMQLQWQVPGSPAFVPVPLNRLYGP